MCFGEGAAVVVVEVGVAAVALVLVAVAVARGRWQWLVVVRWRCWSACGSCVVQCRLVVMALASPALAVMVVLVDTLKRCRESDEGHQCERWKWLPTDRRAEG